MQRIDDSDCPRCHIPLESVLLTKRAGSWKLTCQKCQFQKFKCYCPKCGTGAETTNPLEFGDGLLIKCPSLTCKNRFQVVKCPHPKCGKFNFFNNGNYCMGELISCQSCKTSFQQLACPHCLESNYWRGDSQSFYAAGNITQCYACHGKFQHLQCPHCKQPKYFPNCDYICGIKYDCSYCNGQFQHALCVSCHRPNYYPSCNFKYGTQVTCSNSQCQQAFELVICPECGKENFLQGLRGNQLENILRSYNCWSCKACFSHSLCPFCKVSIFPQPESDFNVGVNTFKCPSCKNSIPDYYKCNTCNKVYLDHKECKVCRPVPTHSIFNRVYTNQNTGNDRMPSLFGGYFNNQGPSIFGPSRSQTSNSGSIFGLLRQEHNNQTKEPQKSEPQEDNEPLDESKACGICFSKNSTMAFVPCGHKKTCQECTDQILKSGNRKCPICRNHVQSAIRIFD